MSRGRVPTQIRDRWSDDAEDRGELLEQVGRDLPCLATVLERALKENA